MSDPASEAAQSWLIESCVQVLYLKELLGEPVGEPLGETTGEPLGELLGENLLNHEPLKELLGDCSCLSWKLSVEKDHLEELVGRELSRERKKELELEPVGAAAGAISAPTSSSLQGEKQSDALLEWTEESLSLLAEEEEKGEGKEKSSCWLFCDGVEGG